MLDTILVTGGAGFIGSHLVDRLISDQVIVKVLDDLSSGNMTNLTNCVTKKYFYFINADLRNEETLTDALKDVKTVFHMAAYPEVRTGYDNPSIFFEQNIRGTFNLLEKVRRAGVETLLFASSSTVYGEPDVMPTSEDYGPLIPISPYGASKLACEAMLSSYCHTYGIVGQVFRLANIIGSRSRHGVIWDFIKKLENNNKRLEILGNGRQSKSYLYVSDCVECLLFCLSKAGTKRFEIFNVGSQDKTDVISIAKTVCNAMNLEDVELLTTGGVDDGRGWIGDVKEMLLDIDKLRKLGWSPRFSSLDAVVLAARDLLQGS